MMSATDGVPKRVSRVGLVQAPGFTNLPGAHLEVESFISSTPRMAPVRCDGLLLRVLPASCGCSNLSGTSA